jgi:hypothetical protein
LKSYIKLIGPSIDKGIDSLDALLRDLRRRFQYGEMVSHIVSVVDPSIDLQTGEYLSKAQLGEYDFYVEWLTPPNPEHVRGLIMRIDEALLYTGCRYAITTKE